MYVKYGTAIEGFDIYIFESVKITGNKGAD